MVCQMVALKTVFKSLHDRASCSPTWSVAEEMQRGRTPISHAQMVMRLVKSQLQKPLSLLMLKPCFVSMVVFQISTAPWGSLMMMKTMMASTPPTSTTNCATSLQMTPLMPPIEA